MIHFKRYHRFQALLPSAIQGLWSLGSEATSEQLSIIPDGHPEIVIPIKGRISYQIGNESYTCTKPSLVGQINQPTSFQLSKDALIFHLKLYPYFLGQLVDQSSYDMANHCESISTFSIELSDLLEAFAERSPQPSQIEENIPFLLSQLKEMYNETKPPLLLADQLNKYQRIKNLDTDAALLKTKYSNRYLELLYKKEIGLSPMKFYKVLRVKKASLLMSEEQNLSLGSIADILGYYDLSHFYKDFKSLSNQCPKMFMQNQQALHKNQDYRNQWDFS